ncbi:MAG: glycosyltransferase family 39 protein [Bacteroidetes bacterium]|nr:glycosyltransferase family 39 protein [Bacteroidota bacterium]
MKKSFLDILIQYTESHASLILTLILISSGILIFFTLDNGHAPGGDFAVYIEQSKAIISGETEDLFEVNRFAMDHSDRHIGPYLYPVGFPLLLAPVTRYFGMNFVVYKLLLLLFFLFTGGVTFILFRDRFPYKLWALLIVFYLLFNYYFIAYLDFVLSDIPFLFFTLLSVYLLERYRKTSNPWLQAMMGVVMFIAFLIRTTGIILFITLILIHLHDDWGMIVRKKIRYLYSTWYRMIPYVLFVIGFVLMQILYIHGEQNHIDLLQAATLPLIFSNLLFYLSEIKKFLILYYPDLSIIVLILSTPIVFAHILMNWRKDLLYLIFIFGILGIYAIWPEREGVRFIFPVIPFYFYFLLKGLLDLHRRFPKWHLRAIPFILLFMIFVQGIFYSYRDFFQDNSANILAPESTEAYEYIQTNTRKDDLFVYWYPRTLRLMTGRNAFSTKDPVRMLNSPADYLVTFREKPFDHPQFNLMFKNKDYSIYSIVRNNSSNQ